MTLMPEDSCDRLLDGCQTIAAAAEASDATMWEVFAIQSYGREVEIERGRVSLAGGGGDGGYGIRVLNEGRIGFAYSANLDGAQQMIDEALRASKLVPAIEGMELPEDKGASEVAGMWDPAVDSTTPEELMQQADSLLQEVEELDSRAMVVGGGVALSSHAGALLTSQGISSTGMVSSHVSGIQVSIDEDDRITSGWSSQQSRSLLQDFTPMCEEGVEWAVNTRDTIEDGGATIEAPVLFTHRGISSLFSNIFCSALRGEKLARKESVWSGKEGQKVMADHLTIIDDGTLDGGSGSGTRDGEGTPTGRNTLIESGILRTGIWSTRDAAEQVEKGNIEFAESTGNAGRGGHQSPPGTSMNNLLLSSTAKQESRETLIEEMDEGFVVQSVMGAHTANPSSGDFSVTSSSILKVEDGCVVGALKQAGISGNLPSAFSDEVSLARMQKANAMWAGGSIIIPDIMLRQGIRVNPS